MATATHRRRLVFVVGAVLLVVVCAGLFVAWTHGAFESRLTYWLDRGQSCGSVSYLPNGRLQDGEAAAQAIACFVTADTHCVAAVLTRNAPGIDTSETETFVVEPRDNHRGCDLGMRFSSGIVGSNRSVNRDVTCAGLASADGRLTIRGCPGFSDFTMP